MQDQRIALRVSHFSLPLAIKIRAASSKRPNQKWPGITAEPFSHYFCRATSDWVLTFLPGLIVVCFGRFWVRGLPFPNARHLGHPFQWKNTLPWHLGPAAKVRILRFKNLPEIPA